MLKPIISHGLFTQVVSLFEQTAKTITQTNRVNWPTKADLSDSKVLLAKLRYEHGDEIIHYSSLVP